MVHVAVIGAYGSAGVSAAETLLAGVDDGVIADLELSLIDDGDPPGGLCILRGCMPSKDLLSAGAHRYAARLDDRLEGIPTVHTQRIVERKDEHVAAFVEHRQAAVDTMARRSEVSLYRSSARFIDDRTLLVGDDQLTVDFVIVATGSQPAIPPIPGIEQVHAHTSADVLDMTAFPERAVIIGFGFIGIELAPYLAEVGRSTVTVIDRNSHPLSEVDPAFGQALQSLYTDAFGITLETGATPTRIDKDGADIIVTFEDEQGAERDVYGDALFTFTGRRPAIDRLDLSAAGIHVDSTWVDDTLATRDRPHIFVAGDANGREPILHVAKEEGIVAARNVIASVRGDPTESYRPIVHRIAFAGLGEVPYARVGHTDASARAAGFDPVTVTRHASDDGVFLVKGVPEGLAALVVDDQSRRVLGYQGLHHHADVFAKTLQVIVANELTVDVIPDRAYHPTTPELLDGLIREACDALAAR